MKSNNDIIYSFCKFIVLFDFPNFNHSMYGIDVEQQNLIMKHHNYIQYMMKKLNIQHHMMSDDVGIRMEHIEYIEFSDSDSE